MEPDEQDREFPAVEPYRDPVAERLFQSRTVIISGEINQELAARVIAHLTALSAASDEPITLIINSQGGHVESGDTIHDFVRFIKPRVKMLGTGWVASAAALIFVAAPREDRYCLPNTRFLLHQPAGGVSGRERDIAIEAEQIIRMRDRVNRIFARETGQPLERIAQDTDRNFWLTAEEAVEYGLVGKVVQGAGEMA